MRKVLFMPLLQISSGHHQVADALADWLKKSFDDIECEKIDILQYGYGPVEKLVSQIYLKWIHYCPSLYSWIYRKSLTEKMEQNKRYVLYEILFERIMKKIVTETKPHLIICTHALPSYLLNRLKGKGEISVPVINAYTDFFVNKLWGLQNIDCHFVADHYLKEGLLSKGVSEDAVHVTGIPIHQKIIKKEDRRDRSQPYYQIIITGGSLGVGKVDRFITTLQPNYLIRYVVLCGKNKRLYEWIKRYNHPYIVGLPYIDSREKMNEIYNNSDGIITKPGGVTLSESLHKNIPIFIYDTLPGQEEMNLNHLKKSNVVFQLETSEELNIEEKILEILQSEQRFNAYQRALQTYHSFVKREAIDQKVNDIIAGLR
ncbi:MGDG synthase family glycosyltransferase [Anaerobacillus sp. MEB173]|uniref:MGDG synthase family glycosyltransferase n=1 Tax=Anaerobacillus sp. MEB173 TaxID=3383345 RepID=UPI003F9330A6